MTAEDINNSVSDETQKHTYPIAHSQWIIQTMEANITIEELAQNYSNGARIKKHQEKELLMNIGGKQSNMPKNQKNFYGRCKAGTGCQ